MIQEMKDLKGGGPVEMLLYDPVAILSSATSVESVETLMVGLMNYWKTVDPTDAVLQKQAADIYAKAMLRRKALAQPGKPQPPMVTPGPFTVTHEILAIIAATALLKPSLHTFKALVAEHPSLTFEAATERLTQGMMANILSLYSTKVPGGEVGYFIEQIAKTLEFKRKIILSGKVGQAYKKIWEEQTGYLSKLTMKTETTPAIGAWTPSASVPVVVLDVTALPVLKPKTKKTKPPVALDATLSFWRSVTDLCAVIMSVCGSTQLTGLTVDSVSPLTEQAMLAFAKKELAYFKKFGSINLPLAVGKYNFLMTLFSQPVSAMPPFEYQVMAEMDGTQYVIERVNTVVRVRLSNEMPV